MDTEEADTRPHYNILVVEDLASWQKKFKRFLRNEPFKVNIAANHHQAQTAFERCAPDLLILDVNLSGVPYNVDGLQVADQLWRQNSNLKIIIVSGDQWWSHRLHSCPFAPAFILEKQSLDPGDLVAKIYLALDQGLPGRMVEGE